MKEKEIKVDPKVHELVLFVEKDDATYGAIHNGSYMAENYLDDYFYKKQNLEKQLKEKQEKGEISPVYYYMLLQDIGIGDLAKRVGISKRKLSRHFRPEVFARLNEAMLQKYAVVFGVRVEEMRSMNIEH